MLSDHEILQAIDRQDITISPAEGVTRRVQPASLDVRLGDTFAVFRRDRGMCIDPKVDSADLLDYKWIGEDDTFVIHPGEFVLGCTLETVGLSDSIVARVEGKSSLGRLGLLVHSTAGFIDPGFIGQITLELACVNSLPIRLYPGMPVAQLAFQSVTPVNSLYAGKYGGQTGPTPSRYHRNWNGVSWT